MQTISVEFPYKNSAKIRKNRKFAKWRLILEVIQNPTKIQNTPMFKPVPNREPHGAARYQVRLPADQYTIRSSCATAQKSPLTNYNGNRRSRNAYSDEYRYRYESLEFYHSYNPILCKHCGSLFMMPLNRFCISARVFPHRVSATLSI